MKDGYFLSYDIVEKKIGLNPEKFHIKDTVKIRDNISHVFVSIKSPSKKAEYLYTKGEIEERARYIDKVKSSSVWNGTIRKTDYEEMIKKTAIKHSLKLMPWPEIIRISEVRQ